MRERILVAPGIKGSELLKSLASSGINCINLKIICADELARLALMKSGIPVKEEFVSSKEENTFIAKAVSGENYFGKTSFSDIKEIASAIRRVRGLVADSNEADVLGNALKRGIFTDKNEALINVYNKYVKLLKDSNMIDGIGLIRKAISEASVVDADFSILTECPLNPLEQALLDKVSAGNYKCISICELFSNNTHPIKIQKYRNCYGSPNEVETILNDIYKEKAIDKCTVAVTDVKTYGQLFFDYALLYDIPMTFGCGIPIINSNPAKLLVLYYDWLTSGFFGKDAILSLLTSDSFDRKLWNDLFTGAPDNFSRTKFYEILGSLRLTNDAGINDKRIKSYKNAISEEEQLVSVNDEKAYKELIKKKACIPYLEKAAVELALPAEEFISKYSKIRKNTGNNSSRLLMSLDLAAKNTIYDELSVVRNAQIDQNADDIIGNVLGTNVMSQGSSEGALHITDVRGAISIVRKNLYIAGLSASKFPGSPTENYLLLDADLKLFGDAALLMTSEGKIRSKIDTINTLVSLASNLEINTYISFAGLNVSELKADNASSIIFELYRRENGTDVTAKELEKSIEKVEYFEPAISATRKIGNAYNNGKKLSAICKSPNTTSAISVTMPLDREWSPSALSKFIECPRKFMFNYLLDVPELEENDPFEIISAMDMGTLAHSLMEQLGDSNLSREDFISLANDYFDRYIAQNPPLIMDNVVTVKSQFAEMMETAYDTDPRREIALKEVDIRCTHATGVKLRGFPDRVEKLDDGTYLIVDFKTGRNIKHIQDDVITCLQVLIYAYMLEQKGYPVSGAEYRYIRIGETVTCKYNDELKQQLSDILASFADAMSKFDFAGFYTEEDSNNTCKFCGYACACDKN